MTYYIANETNSPRQYKSRFDKWGCNKNIKSDEMSAIVRKRQKRKIDEPQKPELVFSVRGSEVKKHKIDRWMKDCAISQNTVFAPSPAAGQ